MHDVQEMRVFSEGKLRVREHISMSKDTILRELFL